MIRDRITTLLQLYSVSKPYFHDGHMQDTKELFSCSYTKAFDALLEIKGQFFDKFGALKEMKEKTGNYNFRNLRNVKNQI